MVAHQELPACLVPAPTRNSAAEAVKLARCKRSAYRLPAYSRSGPPESGYSQPGPKKTTSVPGWPHAPLRPLLSSRSSFTE